MDVPIVDVLIADVAILDVFGVINTMDMEKYFISI